MKVTIDIRSGPLHNIHVTKKDIQHNIDALTRAIEGKPVVSYFILLTDTKSILEGIQYQLPHGDINDYYR